MFRIGPDALHRDGTAGFERLEVVHDEKLRPNLATRADFDVCDTALHEVDECIGAPLGRGSRVARSAGGIHVGLERGMEALASFAIDKSVDEEAVENRG